MPLDAGPEYGSNVIKFPEQGKPSQEEQPKSGTHEMSMLILKEAGFESLEEAKEKLAELKEQKAESTHTMVQKIHDKIFNHGEETRKIMELESQIADLSRKVKAASTTESMEHGESSTAKAA